MKSASANDIRKVHQFIDPNLRRVQLTWDDVEVRARLRDIAEESWAALDKLADDGGDRPDVHATLDEMRAAYASFYEEAEAIASSTALASRREGYADGAAGRPPMGESRGPTGSPWAAGLVPASARRGLRKAIGRERRRGAGALPDIACLEGYADYDVRWAWHDGAAYARADVRVPGQERGAQPAVGAAADVRGRPARRHRRQRVRPPGSAWDWGFN